jgi:hypothetical protein
MTYQEEDFVEECAPGDDTAFYDSSSAWIDLADQMGLKISNKLNTWGD